MKFVISESELVSMIKKILIKEAENTQMRQTGITAIFCNTKNRKIPLSGNIKSGTWCEFVKEFKVTDDEIRTAYRQCPNKKATDLVPVGPMGYPKENENFRNLINIISKDSKYKFSYDSRNSPAFWCSESSMITYINSEDNKRYSFYDNGLLFFKSNDGINSFTRGSWSIENGELKLNLPYTKRGKGYAKTTEDIKSGGKVLAVGSRGDLVKDVQYAIYKTYNGNTNAGCKEGATGPQDCDGVYGPRTKAAVLKYQTDNYLRGKDGTVGAETWNTLF